ncbi:ABC transporter permease [Candidatus Poribacteria bacterium]|nr:ABC transporter permease [Candidatus Poribacteria bacterium]
MKLYDAIAAGLLHISQNRLRAGLSILGIFIGIASVLCMMAIGDGAKRLIVKDIEKMGGANQVHFRTRHSIWRRSRFVRLTTERYTLSDVRAIEAECPDVHFVLPKNRGYQGIITSRQGGQTRPYVEGVTADYATGMHWNVQYGRFFTRADIDSAAQVCVLGAEAAMDLFGNINAIGQEVKMKIRWRHPFVRCRVIGIMAAKGRSLRSYTSLDDIVCVPLTTHQQRLSGIRYIEDLHVFFQKDADVSGVIDSVRDVLQKRHRGIKDFISYRIPKRTVRRLEHIQKMIKIALGSIAGFSIFVSGIGIMNICLVSVGERTREIGLRKSIGAKQIHIFLQFLTESITLCFCGGGLGIVDGWLAAHGMAGLAVRILPIVDEWPVVLSVSWMLTSVVFSVCDTFGTTPSE